MGASRGKIQHAVLDLVRQRVFGLALGYADCHDAARPAHDPLHKQGRAGQRVAVQGLGSQPTLSRFENAISRPALGRMLHGVADTVIATHRRRLGRRRVRRITIDLDPTEDPTHGQQELSLPPVGSTSPGGVPLHPALLGLGTLLTIFGSSFHGRVGNLASSRSCFMAQLLLSPDAMREPPTEEPR